MKRSKVLLAVLLVSFTAMSLVGCKGASTTTTSQADNTSVNQNKGKTGAMTKYDPGITLTIAGTETDPNAKYPQGMDPVNNPWTDAYKSELGITLKNLWTVPASKSGEKLSTQIAAGDIPDILNGLGRAQYDQLIKLGLATPMGDLLNKYGTDLAKKLLNSDGGYAITGTTGDDGKLYGLPYTYGCEDNVPEMWIRMDWLKKLNLQVPKTTAELTNVLNAFVNQDPDGNGKKDTLGLTTTNSLWEAGSIFNAFGAQPFWSWYKDTTGTLKYSTVYNVVGMKNAFTYMQNLYKNGLMDQEFGTVSSDKLGQYITSNKVGITFQPRWYPSAALNTSMTNTPNADWEAYPIPSGLDGGKPAKPFAYYGAASYTVISTKCKYPEAAVKMLNLYAEKVYGPKAQEGTEKYITTKDGFNLTNFALIGSAWANKYDVYNDVAKAMATSDPSKLTLEEQIHYKAALAYKNGDKSKWVDYITYGPNNPTSNVVQYYLKNDVPLFSNYYGPSTNAVKQYQGDLDAKWLTLATQIIMSQKPVSAYDGFVTDWYKLGGDKMEKEINDYAKSHPSTVK